MAGLTGVSHRDLYLAPREEASFVAMIGGGTGLWMPGGPRTLLPTTAEEGWGLSHWDQLELIVHTMQARYGAFSNPEEVSADAPPPSLRLASLQPWLIAG